jgi:hypothetical protein
LEEYLILQLGTREFIETNSGIGSMLGANHYISNIHLNKIEVGFMDIEVVTKEWE